MKRRNNRFLAGTLAGLMMLTMLPVTALAAENGTADETATLTAESIAPVSETLNSSTANVVNDDKDSPAEKAESNDSTDQQGDSSSNTGENSDSNPSANNNGEGGENNTPAPTFTAKIDGTEYETLDAAINAAQDGDTIEIGENCTLTVGTIEKAVVINGNGHTITVPAQEPGNHALNVNAPLTFNNANVVFTNDIDNVNQWSVTMNSDGVLTLDKGSTCTIETHGIYANANAVINVKGGSELTIRNTTYTAMMGENYALLNIENDSHLLIENSAINGMTRFITTVTGSTLRVLNCANQGLVRCPLTLDDSTAEISGNNYGISGYNKTDVLTMKNRSSMTMEDNKSAGIFLYGGNIDVQDGTTLTITGTGKDLDNTDDRSVGALAVYYLYNTYTANVTFADGASVNLVDNAVSAINNDGTLYIGKGTTIGSVRRRYSEPR